MRCVKHVELVDLELKNQYINSYSRGALYFFCKTNPTPTSEYTSSLINCKNTTFGHLHAYLSSYCNQLLPKELGNSSFHRKFPVGKGVGIIPNCRIGSRILP